MKWIHKLIFALSICTISLVALYSVLGDTRKLVITPEQFNIYATKDASEGGLSTADITYDAQSLVLNCELKKSSYAWPYCGISVYTDVAQPTHGIDLSNYHTIRLKLHYEEAGNGQNPSYDLRLYLRNYNPEYSKPDDEYTIKYNGMQFSPSNFSETIEIPIKNLQVMTWWLADNKVDIEHSAPEFSNITRIDIATGSGAALGQHKIVIDKIEFEGAYLAQETLLFALLFSWMALGLAFSLHELRKNRAAYEKAKRRHRHLEKVNGTLRAQNYEFAELAHRDALTGAMNRHAVQTWLEQQARQVRWGHSTLSILYMDLDNFKKINDKFGHQMGDDILREFVMVVASSIAPDDRLVRWGGEEFVVFCPDTNIEQAVKKAEMIRKNVANHLWVHGEALTCSIGVAQMQNERVTETMARADEVLYLAKRNGRNCVEVNYGLLSCQKNEA
ncbi:TPA: GGDEF domain-containing protein [Vibrio parahaemolyticus]|uniref:GGDEF domain-containing protein n=1 Tax=Vibrio parahaemolyticus TaxID=670 RepID=UPI000FEC90DE|nr:GGDEF domain-containing protein [Vibrio parahaemolyticus]MCX8882212.1 GGDEF domain-containing protein [Vibrio parahaemolyticus]HAS3028089.1 GGDEF domain-containing protein [Vibrio parahaemolyticus]HAS3030463.1 GGDEF domain-containing protein [Vibrio parahaemolyticus]HAS3033366.1 GGDEF domain-containing protein [Vibrio parahaemolyticus]HAS3035741.1 GGDEF domain-containing protein [Vibrio parahaemolyticus]